MSGTITTFGVTPTGFVRKRLPDLLSDIASAVNTNLAVVTGDPNFQIDLSATSNSGQTIAVMAEQYATLWEVAEAVWNSAYPVTASGVSLDNAVSFSGVTRLQESSTTVYAVLYGLEGTSVPEDSTATQSSTGLIFELQQTTIITAALAADVTLAVLTVADSTQYTVTVNSVQYQITSAVGSTVQSIMAQLATVLANSGLTISQPTTSVVRIVGIGRVSFSASASTNLTISNLGTVGEFVCETEGANVVNVGELNTASSATTNWNGVSNLIAGVAGRDQETDAELRARYVEGVFGLGAGTMPAIYANILNNVDGVTNVTVLENTTATADASGQVGHSIQCVVQGGDDLAVAQMIYLMKPAGIATYGTTTVPVTLANGVVYKISFTRPSLVYAWVNVTTTLLPEETFPGNGDAAVAQAIVNYGNTLPVGHDVVIQRFYGPVFDSVSGIASLNVTMAFTLDGSTPAASSYTAANYGISPTQLAVFAPVRVSAT